MKVLRFGQLAHCGLPFLITQWTGERLQKGTRLSGRQLLSAERALRSLHALGVVHGDLHGGNVLVDGQHVVFCDLARSRQSSSAFDVSNDRRSVRELADTPA